MRVKRHPKLENQIYEAARESLEKSGESRAKGLHFSDLLNPRQAYFKITDPQPLSEDEVGYFVAGLAHHDVILSIMKKKGVWTGETDEGSKEWNGVWYSPDFNLGFLAEIKTNRSPNEPEDNMKSYREKFDTYLDQLGQYMAAENKLKAALIVFFIARRRDKKNKSTHPVFRAYKVTMKESERDEILERMEKTKQQLLKVIDNGKFKTLPLCAHWMCARGGYRGPATAACKWYEKCKPEGRYPLETYATNRKAGKFK